MLGGATARPADMMVTLSCPTILLINHVTVCLPYQEQFALTADEDLKVVKPGSGKKLEEGVEFCRHLCEDLNAGECVTHQWVGVLER